MSERFCKRRRTECSLGHLANRFVSHLPRQVSDSTIYEFSIQEVKEFFNAKETAVYDMLSILESILLVTKIGKKSYQWNGTDHLKKTLVLLRCIGIAMNFGEDLKEAHLKHQAGIVEMAREMMDLSTSGKSGIPCSTPNTNFNNPEKRQGRKEKLHFLEEAQRFLMMFLVSGPGEHLSMPICYTAIFKDNVCETRRLYDIANVLSGLPSPILRRTVVGNKFWSKKREFVYCGPDVTGASFMMNDLHALPEYRRKNMVISKGLKLLNILERPRDFPGCQIVRVVHTDDGLPVQVEGSDDLYVKSVPLSRMILTQELLDFVNAIY